MEIVKVWGLRHLGIRCPPLVVTVAAGVLAVACGGSAGSGRQTAGGEVPEPAPAVSSPPPGGKPIWEGRQLTGLPPGTLLWDVDQALDGRTVAVGTVAASDCADSPQLVVWHSQGGLEWEQTFRAPEPLGMGSGFCGERHASVTTAGEGFAVVGWGCEEVCAPVAFHSPDGRRWNRASVPSRPVWRDEPRRSSGGAAGSGFGRPLVVRASPEFTLEGEAMHEVVAIGDRLVAVGWEERRAEPVYSTSGAAWVSDDLGATWSRAREPFPDDGSRSELSRVEVAGGRLVAGGGNRCCYDQVSPQLWVSETGDQWRPAPLPDGAAVALDDIESLGEVGHVVGTTSIHEQPPHRPVHWRLDPRDRWQELPPAPMRGELALGVDALFLFGVDRGQLVKHEFIDEQGFREMSRSRPMKDMRLLVALTTDDVPLVFASGDGRWWRFAGQ